MSKNITNLHRLSTGADHRLNYKLSTKQPFLRRRERICWRVLSTGRILPFMEQPDQVATDPGTSPWTIRQRCLADWDAMPGDDQRRFCGHCQKHVYNLSALTPAERAKFATPGYLHECVFYSRRANGEIADLSLLARLRRWFPILRLACWSALLGVLPVTLTGCMGVRCPRPGEIQRLPPNPPPDSPPTTNQTNNVQSPQ